MFDIISSSGAIVKVLFGQSCSPTRINLGKSLVSSLKYKSPESNGSNGYLYIKSSNTDLSLTILFTSLYVTKSATLEETTESEYNNATSF